jgi:hypothetical protein
LLFPTCKIYLYNLRYISVPLRGFLRTVELNEGVFNAALHLKPQRSWKEIRMARTLQVAPRATRKPRTAKAGPTLEQIQTRAYEIYLERRGASGNQVDDWLRAERELILAASAKPRKSVRAPKSEAA